jgi:hypothetical protein
MSNFNGILTGSILPAVKAAVVAAWGDIPISYDRPPRMPLATPYALVLWDKVDISFSGRGAGVGSPGQDNTFTIVGRFPFPSDPTQPVALQKVDQANLLIAQLQTGEMFAGLGMLPLVTSVDPGSDDGSNNLYEVVLTFNLKTVVFHH